MLFKTQEQKTIEKLEKLQKKINNLKKQMSLILIETETLEKETHAYE
tara:strand:+ start:297 stop:437 length:141 start_codon:yes stop_codon:yes gene_type:complete